MPKRLGAAAALVTLGMALERYVWSAEVFGTSGLVMLFALALGLALLSSSPPRHAAAKVSNTHEGDRSTARVDATTGLPNRPYGTLGMGYRARRGSLHRLPVPPLRSHDGGWQHPNWACVAQLEVNMLRERGSRSAR